MEAKQAALRRKAHLTTLGDRGFLSLSFQMHTSSLKKREHFSLLFILQIAVPS
jgi:hypothetical protein